MKKEYKRVLLIGAGEAGSMIVKEIKNKSDVLKIELVGIIDDDIEKLGKEILGTKIIGTSPEIPNIANKLQVDEIIFSIANIDPEKKKDILDFCRMTGCSIKTIPGIYEIIDGKVDYRRVRDIEIEDLLGRSAVILDKEKLEGYLEGKVVLVTGGGGSIGSEICRQVSLYSPRKLIILDNNENNAYSIYQELKMKYKDGIDVDIVIANIREFERLDSVFSKYKPNIVFHAAAHKHVPILESNMTEAIKNNISGTDNLIRVSDKYGVDKFVLISTDKAVNPTNIMGATKRATEIMIQAINEVSDTEFVAVRFGNVLGSSGSVIPLFKKQIAAGGPLTLTHKDIIRYFMTIEEAASLVLEASTMAKGGEIFILDMGQPVKIYDLAVKMIRLSGYEPQKDIEIKITGLREGEKLFEELLMDEEGIKSTEHSKIFIGSPHGYDYNEVRKKVDEVVKVAYLEDEKKVETLMREFVPTYIHPEDVNGKR